MRGITPFRGLTNHGPMVINHLLTGMILQVVMGPKHPVPVVGAKTAHNQVRYPPRSLTGTAPEKLPNPMIGKDRLHRLPNNMFVGANC